MKKKMLKATISAIVAIVVSISAYVLSGINSEVHAVDAIEPTQGNVTKIDSIDVIEPTKTPEATNEATFESNEPTESSKNTEATTESEEKTKEVEETKEVTPEPTVTVEPAKPAHTHSYSKTTTAATCKKDGVETYTCKCGHSYTKQIAAIGHDYDANKTPATCTEGGYTTYTCVVCGDSYVSDRTSENGHSYKAVVTAPEIGVQGFTTHTCSVCGDTYVDSYVDALHEHSYECSLIVPANCTTEGYSVYRCACGDEYHGDITAKTAHNYVSNVVAPTHTEKGYTMHVCSGCGNCYNDSYTDVLVEEPEQKAEPVVEEEKCCDGEHKHVELVVGGYTYVYCEHVEAPYVDGYTIYYPHSWYF